MIAILCVGIPACGKSTLARTLETVAGFREVNRDAHRFILTGSTRDHTQEAAVTAYGRNLIQGAARDGSDLIVSDTNLHAGFRRELIQFLRDQGYDEVNALVWRTPLAECIRRNAERPDPVPEQAMHRMAAELEAQSRAFAAEFDHVAEVPGV